MSNPRDGSSDSDDSSNASVADVSAKKDLQGSKLKAKAKAAPGASRSTAKAAPGSGPRFHVAKGAVAKTVKNTPTTTSRLGTGGRGRPKLSLADLTGRFDREASQIDASLDEVAKNMGTILFEEVHNVNQPNELKEFKKCQAAKMKNITEIVKTNNILMSKIARAPEGADTAELDEKMVNNETYLNAAQTLCRDMQAEMFSADGTMESIKTLVTEGATVSFPYYMKIMNRKLNLAVQFNDFVDWAQLFKEDDTNADSNDAEEPSQCFLGVLAKAGMANQDIKEYVLFKYEQQFKLLLVALTRNDVKKGGTSTARLANFVNSNLNKPICAADILNPQLLKVSKLLNTAAHNAKDVQDVIEQVDALVEEGDHTESALLKEVRYTEKGMYIVDQAKAELEERSGEDKINGFCKAADEKIKMITTDAMDQNNGKLFIDIVSKASEALVIAHNAKKKTPPQAELVTQLQRTFNDQVQDCLKHKLHQSIKQFYHPDANKLEVIKSLSTLCLEDLLGDAHKNLDPEIIKWLDEAKKALKAFILAYQVSTKLNLGMITGAMLAKFSTPACRLIAAWFTEFEEEVKILIDAVVHYTESYKKRKLTELSALVLKVFDKDVPECTKEQLEMAQKHAGEIGVLVQGEEKVYEQATLCKMLEVAKCFDLKEFKPLKKLYVNTEKLMSEYNQGASPFVPHGITGVFLAKVDKIFKDKVKPALESLSVHIPSTSGAMQEIINAFEELPKPEDAVEFIKAMAKDGKPGANWLIRQQGKLEREIEKIGKDSAEAKEQQIVVNRVKAYTHMYAMLALINNPGTSSDSNQGKRFRDDIANLIKDDICSKEDTRGKKLIPESIIAQATALVSPESGEKNLKRTKPLQVGGGTPAKKRS